MMGLGDFGLSVLASWFANRLEYRPKSATQNAGESSPIDPDKPAVAAPEQSRTVKFQTFDAWTDLSKLLSAVKDPLISVLIEDEPSTFYRLASLVLESRVTGEWFVFTRGRMSFQGSGGGLRNSRDILEQVKQAGAPVGVWILPQALMSALDNGYETWGAIKPHAIPLLARVAKDYSWSEIERNVSEQLKRDDPPPSAG
jgi:hypothetical protein